MAGTTRISIKDLVEKLAGPEPDPVVYEFRRTGSAKRSDGQFKEPADQTGHGVYGQTEDHDN